MERPALRQLLTDIEAGRVVVVVVYKVDRLTRSLADFAKIVETFDSRNVSFVSVTQAFNTTSSMGRLTLNVLLSFAQFEREVTGERIRDKIAASKAKGLRMGGRPPLGYDVCDLRLVINQAEADTVRHIFKRYLDLGAATPLLDELNCQGICSKAWTMRSGDVAGGQPFRRGGLYYLLSNPVYRGCNVHKDKLYPDCHPAIIDEETWDAVQRRLGDTNASKPTARLRAEEPLLRGLVFDDRGHAMGCVHTTRRSKRYRYYLSQPNTRAKNTPLGSLHRVSAGVLDRYVVDVVQSRLSPSWAPGFDAASRCRDAIIKIIIGADQVAMTLRASAVTQESGLSAHASDIVELRLPITLKRREGAVIILPHSEGPAARLKADKTLIKAVVLARSWAAEIAADRFRSVKELARSHGLCANHTMRILPLAFLAPDLVMMIIEGRQPATLSLKTLTDKPLPMDWDNQRRSINIIRRGLDYV
jgi:site-specific DNA recombinase